MRCQLARSPLNRLPLLAIAAAVGAGLASSSVAGSHSARLVLRPSVTRLGARTRLTVYGVGSESLQVLLSGASDPSGNPFRWQSFRRVDGTWVTSIPPAGRRGIYPLRVRVNSRAPSFRSPSWFLRVLAPGTRSRPSFAAPVGVVRWWVRAVPHGTLVAVKHWPLAALDRRDKELHRLFVIAYRPLGSPDPDDEKGVFITTFRDGYGARWRLLEAKLLP